MLARTPLGRAFWLTAALLAVAAPSEAQDLKRGPYLQNQTETTVTVMWMTRGAGHVGAVDVAGVGTFPAESRGQEELDITRHEARVTGLAPGTAYRYRIVINGKRREDWWVPFHTNKPRGTDFRFLAIGDSGDLFDQSHQKRVAAQMLLAEPDFYLHVGDLVYPNYVAGDPDYNTLRHFAIYQELHRSVPHWITRGNHDTAVELRLDFEFPTTGPRPELPEVYWFEYGDLLVISLSTGGGFVKPEEKPVHDSLRPGGWQSEWLKELLGEKSGSYTWKLVMFHRPTYSSAERYRSFMNPGSREIAEMCEDGGVDFVLFGHVHSMQRSKPIRRGEVVEASRGVVHFESGGSGGTNLGGEAPREYTGFVNGSTWGFLQTDVTYDHTGNSTATFRFIDENGETLDEWSKTKSVVTSPGASPSARLSSRAPYRVGGSSPK
jgi:predicted phosphodiesterase